VAAAPVPPRRRRFLDRLMDRIRIRGGVPLKGEIRIGGAKNAALPLMAASLLTEETLTLSNLPQLADISTLTHLLAQHGVEITMNGDGGNGGHDGRTFSLTAREIVNTVAPYDLVRKMRASVLVLGPLLARCGHAEVSLPGGCAIGTRPVDLHLKGLAQLGAEIELLDGYIRAAAPQGLTGATIRLDQVSVGATENLLMAACLARGETVIENAAREPEVTDLALCLRAMGAEIEGVGSERLVIRGREALQGAEYQVLADRIETGSYAAAVAITGGDVELLGGRLDHLEAVAEALGEAGVEMVPTPEGLRVRRTGNALGGVDVTTQPYPGFPTDMQAQVMALSSVADGASTITETIFENRFMHVPELVRMGARISVTGPQAVIRGVPCRWSSPGSPPRARPWSAASTTSTGATSGWWKSSRPAAPTSSA
jgi:UDP-N-acetylglucosamine 1-carboxyvinyltransferase